MSPKNIYIINQFAGTPESGWGERHYYFAEYWIKNGHTVNIISATYNHMFSQEVKSKKKFTTEDHEGRKFCWIKTPKYNPKTAGRFWSMSVFAFRVLQLPVHLLGKPDVIIVSSMPIFPVVTANWLRKKFKGCKLIFEIRDLWPETPIHLGGYSKNHPFIKLLAWFEQYGFRHADYIVSLLPNAATYINGVSGSPEKFRYIPNGLSSDQLTDELIPEECRSQIPRNKFIIGYAGTIGLANALEYFVSAARILMNEEIFHFIITGEGYLKSELIQSSADLNNITFLPRIKKNQVQDLLKYFDVCFVGRSGSPLFKHGVSANKYFDYMLASKPVLDSNALIKDPVELSGCGIIVAPDNAEEIAIGARKFLEMPVEERRKMGLKGRSYVELNHAVKNLSLRYEELF